VKDPIVIIWYRIRYMLHQKGSFGIRIRIDLALVYPRSNPHQQSRSGSGCYWILENCHFFTLILIPNFSKKSCYRYLSVRIVCFFTYKILFELNRYPVVPYWYQYPLMG
jgi:hypothetical protein